MYQTAVKYTNIFDCKDNAKFTQIWILGLKIRHLATQSGTTFFVQFAVFQLLSILIRQLQNAFFLFFPKTFCDRKEPNL
jgi:hypothetical protein